MYADSSVRSPETGAAPGDATLVQGLMLARASILKMIRLQLAIERRDRIVALETVDDLVDLDRRLRVCLDFVPASAAEAGLRNGVEADRAALNREKLTLAAEVLHRPAEPDAALDSAQTELPAVQFDPEPPRRRWRLVAVMLLLLTIAGAVWFGLAWTASAPGAGPFTTP